MPDPQTNALIARLERSRTRWKRLALGVLSTLLLGVVTAAVFGVYEWKRVRAARAEAEAQRDQAIRNAERAREAKEEISAFLRGALAEPR
jgi:hypothetical protein